MVRRMPGGGARTFRAAPRKKSFTFQARKRAFPGATAPFKAKRSR